MTVFTIFLITTLPTVKFHWSKILLYVWEWMRISFIGQVCLHIRSVLEMRGPEWFCQLFCSLWMSTVLGEWGGFYQWFAQQFGLPSVLFWGQIWLLSWTRQLLMCRGRIQWWPSRTVSAAPVVGWTFSAGEGNTASAGPFSQWIQCVCPTSGPGRWCFPGIWMTPLQSQCCSWWWVGGEQVVSP